MKPTLEQIQAALSDQLNMNRGGMTIEKFLEKHDAKITYALELAEQVAKGEVVLVETGNYAAMLNAMPRELKQMLPQPPQEASDERD